MDLGSRAVSAASAGLGCCGASPPRLPHAFPSALADVGVPRAGHASHADTVTPADAARGAADGPGGTPSGAEDAPWVTQQRNAPLLPLALPALAELAAGAHGSVVQHTHTVLSGQ